MLRLYTSLMELQAAALTREAVNMHLAAKLSLATDKVSLRYPCTMCCIDFVPPQSAGQWERIAVYLPDEAA